MKLQKITIAFIIGLTLFKWKNFSFYSLNKYFLQFSQRALYYFLNKPIEKQKLFQALFKQIVKLLGVILKGGKIVLDNSTIDKSYSKDLEGASYVWDSRKKRSVYGYSIVYMIWVINGCHIPIGYQIYVPGDIIPGKFTKKGNPKRKRASKTHSDIACELLSFARNTLKIKPDSVHFDEFYTCQKLLKLLKGYGWVGIFAMRSSAKFKKEKLNKRKWKSEPEWGELTCGIKITLMKDGKNYYGTTKYGATRWWIKKMWDERWCIEEDFRFLKSKLYWEACQSTSKKVQENHFTLGLITFSVIQLLSNELECSCYDIKESADFNKVKLRKIATKLLNI